MPTCQNCGEKWTWVHSFFFVQGKPCPYCGKKQYANRRSRKIFFLISFIIPMPVLLPAFVDVSPLVSLSVLIGTFLLCSGSYPFLLKLSNKEEFISLYMIKIRHRFMSVLKIDSR
ncbi:TIGR04104 family putative zinc finger protein [Salibacterium aidingense]|uniref:TIGR04104 family putative zinc finger protein n=1 Tax=Salibacterium aidingense TaxID=384933 RepID=UPI0006875782|nr:TIGR04104 family putative zinc finger protein [Salibacterium aidingense]